MKNLLGILQTISCYSLLQSPLRLPQLVTAAKQRGYQAVALTDRNVLYGTVEFYQLCQKSGIKPLIGMTLQLASHDEVILLAQNDHGYHNLMKISTLKNKQLATGEHEMKPAVLQKYLNDLYLITPLNAQIISLIEQGQAATAAEYISNWLQYLAPKDFLIGVSPQLPQLLVQNLLQMAAKAGVKTTALDPVNYLDEADAPYVKVLQAIDQGNRLQSNDWLQKPQLQAWLRPAEMLVQSYQAAGMQVQLQQAAKICQTASFKMQFSAPRLPHFPVPKEQTATSYLQSLCVSGLKKRQIDVTASRWQVYAKRLTSELQVIQKMGFADYFLIVWDVTNFAHQAKIAVGPGRGSAAGSLVAYALAITDVDPIRYDLLFERFLNAQRAQMPDIDLDIPDSRRQEVINYVQKRYGADHVAQIITFGTMGAHQVLRDVGRVMGINQTEMNTWSRLIPHELKITLKAAWQKSPKLRDRVAASEKNQLIFKTALYLEGLPRHFSIHAAGVILSDQRLTELIPLQVSSDGMLLSQYTKDYVEQLGLLKFDFLGLRNLTVLDKALFFVKKDFDPQFDIQRISLADPPTLQLFLQAKTTGIFQFESAGIRNVLRRLKPESFEDLTAVNALFRPGPMENIDHFIARKHHQEPIVYPDESLKPILQKTYGILVYQEQVMQVASVMGGFSLAEADLLRRAMSKKKANQITELKNKFIAGAQKKGYQKQTALQVYDYIERFANYGFNRSHAVAYTKMAFELAYLKCHFPAAFMAALLDSAIGDHEKTKEYVLEARQLKVKFLAPNVNYSHYGFSLYKGAILFGLGSIRLLRRDFIWEILKERKTSGRYRDFQDFLQRLPQKFLKPESLQPLIYSGACDCFGLNRATLLRNLTKVLDNVLLSGNNVELLAVLAPKLEMVPELELSEKLSKEEEYLGTFLSAHPVEQYQKIAEFKQTTLISQLQPKTSATIMIYLKKIKEIRTKKGDEMAFLSGEDQSGQIEIIAFPNVYRQYPDLQTQQVYLLTGKVELRGEQKQLIAVRIIAAQSLKTKMKKVFFIRLPVTISNEKKHLLWKIIKQYQGDNPVIIYEVQTAKKMVLPQQYWLSADAKMIGKITGLLGKENLVIKDENQ